MLSDFIGLKSITCGYWFGVSCHLTSKFGFSSFKGSKSYSIKGEGGKLESKEEKWDISLPALFEIKNDDMKYKYANGVNLYEYFVAACAERKAWRPLPDGNYDKKFARLDLKGKELNEFLETFKKYNFEVVMGGAVIPT